MSPDPHSLIQSAPHRSQYFNSTRTSFFLASSRLFFIVPSQFVGFSIGDSFVSFASPSRENSSRQLEKWLKPRIREAKKPCADRHRRWKSHAGLVSLAMTCSDYVIVRSPELT